MVDPSCIVNVIPTINVNPSRAIRRCSTVSGSSVWPVMRMPRLIDGILAGDHDGDGGGGQGEAGVCLRLSGSPAADNAPDPLWDPSSRPEPLGAPLPKATSNQSLESIHCIACVSWVFGPPAQCRSWGRRRLAPTRDSLGSLANVLVSSDSRFHRATPEHSAQRTQQRRGPQGMALARQGTPRPRVSLPATIPLPTSVERCYLSSVAFPVTQTSGVHRILLPS